MAFPLFRSEPPASLSAEESAELSARMAALAQSGLPLEGGLYALADEIARPRLSGVLCNLAQRLEAGEKLETAIAAQGSRLPAHLRGLIVAGVRNGRLPIVLDQFATLTQRQQDLRRRVLLALSYPALLLGIMAALMVFCRLFLTEQFVQLFRDFNMNLPGFTDIYFRFSGVAAWAMLGLAIVAVIVPLAAVFLPLGAWLGRGVEWIPVLGSIVRDDRYAQFSSLMALLLKEEVPLPDALRLTSSALQSTMLSGSCRAAATAIEAGMPLDEAMVRASFPDSLTALVAWGQKKNGVAEAFRSAAEMFEARTNSQSALLNMLVLPLIYMIIITFVGFTVIALIAPLLALMQSLCDFGRPQSRDDDSLAFLALYIPILVFLPGVLTLMMARLATGPDPANTQRSYTALRVFAWFLVLASGVAGAYLVLPGLGILWLASLAIVISMAYSKHVATQRYAMLALVGAAAERSMPLETAFAAYGHERRGWMRRRAAEIASMLHEGAPLPAALAAVPGVLPPEAVPMLCVGYESGSLVPAIDQAITARNLFEPVWQSIVPKIGYVCMLPAAAVGILAFIAIKIMPQFEKIFKDFNTQMPDITRGVISACRSAPVWLLLCSAGLVMAGLLLYAVLRYSGSIRWDLPGMGWLMRRRHIATVLDAIAMAVQRQRPLGEALATLASFYPQRSIAHRLQAVCDELQAGGGDFECLYRHGLLSKTDLALLQSARQNGNLAWAAREMADSNRRRFIYRTYALLQLIFPPIIVVYGLLMAVITAAVFYPLAGLIQRLTPL